MKKIIWIVACLTLLFFSSNSFACDCSDGCDECWPTSQWCKCATECNAANPDCDPEEWGDPDCMPTWTGWGYVDYSKCVTDHMPYEMVFFGPGNNCVTAVCKFFLGYAQDDSYKSIGKCIKDNASKYILYGEEYSGVFAVCNAPASVDWVEGCECIKEVMWLE